MITPYRQAAREAAKALVRTYFKNDYSEPFELTDGQADIFNLIVTKRFPRNQVIAYTQYGKSDTVAMALIIRSTVYKEPWSIISGQKEKAMIIMSRVIQHSFDHERFQQLLDLDGSIPLERLRRERTKDNLTYKGGGAIRVFTANTKNRLAVKEALTGFGSPNIIEDEASLIPDDVQAMILRMLGGHPNNFLLKIGNPFYRNHFFRTWNSERYYKILIDYKQGIAEGRVRPDYIEEMRGEAFFQELYECLFPTGDSFTSGGWRQLISEDLLNKAFISEEEARNLKLWRGVKHLGADIGGGGDRSAYVKRSPHVMRVLSTNNISDTMQQIPIIEGYLESEKIEDYNTVIDYGGLGQGVGDRLEEKGLEILKIRFGQSSPEPDKYKNMRAFMYYRLWQWLLKGGRIVRDDRFLELLSVNYKQDSEQRFAIQPKEDLKKLMKERGIQASSPDVADAAVLTFAEDLERMTEDDFELI